LDSLERYALMEYGIKKVLCFRFLGSGAPMR
jgi:hypothetical protein